MSKMTAKKNKTRDLVSRKKPSVKTRSSQKLRTRRAVKTSKKNHSLSKVTKGTAIKTPVKAVRIKKRKNEKTFEELLNAKVSAKKIRKNIRGELLKIKKIKSASRIYSSPYAYIYSNKIKGTKHEKLIRSIENRLTDLDISGRKHKLSQFKNLEEIIEEDVRRGITTIVVVGDDTIVKEAISIAADLDIVLGIIPVGTDNKIAEMLGVPSGIAACDVLSQRIVVKMDVGSINGKSFFSNIEIPDQKRPLLCDNKYEIMALGGSVFIYNISIDEKNLPIINPKDGMFEVIVYPRQSLGDRLRGKPRNHESIFYSGEITMEGKSAFIIYIDGKKNTVKNLDIEIVPDRLRLIAGRGRKI